MLCALLCLSCSHRALHEAQSVVAEADSLRTVGQLYPDSTQLAQAYTTLKHWQTIHPDDYARACYHYGRLLRSAEHYPEAMTCFINATHSRSTDYHILGRVYSNMGSLCHLADEFSLSYDMYNNSSQMFLRAGDSLLYYNALNEMAYELAEQGKYEETLQLLWQIEKECEDSNVLEKVIETKSEMYRNVERYDSAIYYANQLHVLNRNDQVGPIVKAHSYSRLGMKDSAILYANNILSDSCSSYQNRFNALYILSHNDSTLNQDEIRAIASEREDIRYYEYEPTKNHLLTAIQLLKLDLHRKPDRRWLYATFLTILVIGFCLWGYIHHKRRRYQLLSQQVNELENINYIETQRHERIVQEHAQYQNRLAEQLEQTCAAFCQSQHLQKDLCWSNDKQMYDIVNQQLFYIAQKLQTAYSLNNKEIRLCVLVLIGVSNSKQLADMLYYCESGVRNFKSRTAQKLYTNSVELRNKLIKIAIGECSYGNEL